MVSAPQDARVPEKAANAQLKKECFLTQAKDIQVCAHSSFPALDLKLQNR